MRLAQECTAPKPSKPSSSSRPSPSKPPPTSTRPSLNRSKSSGYLKPRKKGPTNGHLSTADAQWFLRLPAKVQRRHFTQDEQRILAGHGEEVILDATDTTLYRIGHQLNRSIASFCPSSSSTDSTTSSLYFEAEENPSDSSLDMDDAMLENFRWMDTHDHLDLTLDDYHLHVASTAGTKFLSDRRPTFHQNLSLSAIPLYGSSPPASYQTSSVRTATPISRSSVEKPHHRRQISRASTTNFLPIHQNRLSTEPITTRYYQDPEARLKLRVYLASPSKFDEAVEFGFPSLAQRPPLSGRRYATAPANPETFFDDDSPSLFNALDTSDDDDDNAASLPDLDPITPSSAVFPNIHRLPLSKRPSTEKCTSTTSTSNDSHDLRSTLKPKIRYLSPQNQLPISITIIPDRKPQEGK